MQTLHLHQTSQAKPTTVQQALAHLADLQDSLQKQLNTQRSKVSKQKKADSLGITLTELNNIRRRASYQKLYPMFSPEVAYIYMLVINGYTYIGSSKRMSERFVNHSCRLRKGNSPHKEFQQAYNDNIEEHQLEVHILAEVPVSISKDELEAIELSFIAIESSTNPLNTNTFGTI